MTKGMRFRRLDLHIHTPASACFIEPDVTPGMIVQQAIGAGMEAIAITDHNSGEWVDRVKAAAAVLLPSTRTAKESFSWPTP